VKKKLLYYWKESKGVVLSLAVTAAVLPFALWAMFSRNQIMTWAKASPSDQLMIWFEPAEVVMKPGQSVNMDIMAEYSGDSRLIPALKTNISVTSGLNINMDVLEYNFGFSGRKKLGTLTITAVKEGDQSVSVSEKNVFTSLPDLPIITAPGKVFVR
jgi:hypothetical protein